LQLGELKSLDNGKFDYSAFYPFDPIPGSPFYDQSGRGQVTKDLLAPEATRTLTDQASHAFYFRPRFLLQRLQAFVRHPFCEVAMLVSGATMWSVFWLKKWHAALKPM
jgi:hypothetical protein